MVEIWVFGRQEVPLTLDLLLSRFHAEFKIIRHEHIIEQDYWREYLRLMREKQNAVFYVAPIKAQELAPESREMGHSGVLTMTPDETRVVFANYLTGSLRDDATDEEIRAADEETSSEFRRRFSLAIKEFEAVQDSSTKKLTLVLPLNESRHDDADFVARRSRGIAEALGQYWGTNN